MRTTRQNNLLAFVGLHHYPQKRKYTGEPYTVHLIAVAEMADKYKLKLGYEIGLTHDLFEDTACTNTELREALIRFGYSLEEANYICLGVLCLTDNYTTLAYPNLNRKKRKQFEVERMATIFHYYQSIKYCDLIDNTKSIVEHDQAFAKVYLEEKRQLLEVMNKGNKILYKKALSQIPSIEGINNK